MSAAKTVSYGLGKICMNGRLLLLVSTNYVIEDSFDFVQKIQQSAHTSDMMILFDVISLFRNV
jgi:hypothetical protein